ncbi:MAG: NADPH-dependent 7-cyano-7-deazaguanine reductase QueF, partial [Pseudomonadota bacterium]
MAKTPPRRGVKPRTKSTVRDATGTDDLTQLGQHQAGPASPEAATLETVPNPRPKALYLARFVCPEFTSLCPVTAQPDFAHLVID